MVRGGSELSGALSGIYLGGGGDEVSCDMLAVVVSNPGPTSEDKPVSGEETLRKAVTSH